MKIKASNALLAAMALLDSPKRWVKNALAQESTGITVDPASESACKFCMVGSLYRVIYVPGVSDQTVYERRDAINVLKEVIAKRHPRSLPQNIPDFNDNIRTTHTDVLEVLMTATLIALANEDS